MTEFDVTSYDGIRKARKSFSGIGIALTVIMAAALGFQLLCIYVLPSVIGRTHWLYTSSWGQWILSFVPLYAVGMPLGYLFIRPLPKQLGMPNSMRAKDFFVFLLMCFPLMYGGNIIGNLLSALLSGGQAQNQLVNMVMDNNPLRIVIMVILAPLLEELVFRKLIIDHTRQYGEKTAVLFSAVCFGLFHNNLFQFFYAFAIGLILGYVYLRYNRLRYSVLFHMIINFMGAVIAPWILTKAQGILKLVESGAAENILSQMDAETAGGMLIYMAYMLFLFALTCGGIAALIIRRKQFVFLPGTEELPPGQRAKTVCLNVGVILFTLACLTLIVLNLL